MKALFLIMLTLSSFSKASNLDSLELKLNQKIDAMIASEEANEIFMLKNKFKNYKMSNGVFLLKGYPVEEISKELKDNFKKYKLDKEAEKYFKQAFSDVGHGTGFYYRGYIVTNFHVCRGQNVLAKGFDGDISSFSVLTYNSSQDICILKPNFKKDKYADFANLESKTPRNISSEVTYTSKDIFVIDSIYGKIESNKLRKDDVKDQWSKNNTYFTNNLREGECRGGISGSPVVGPNGFFGLAWGSSTGETNISNQYCFLIEKKSIDELIDSI